MTSDVRGWRIYHGDSRDMAALADDSVDLVCTDPPYGISFMGKDWDKVLPDVAVWHECLRVLKPGAFAFVMCIPRADCLSRMIASLEAAGFRVNFTPIYWAYASGFPKAQNIGKAVDKRNGRQRTQYLELGSYIRAQRGPRPQKELARFFPSKTGGLTGCVANWELGLNVPTAEQWAILKLELNLDARFDELIEREEAEREVIGKSPHGYGPNTGASLTHSLEAHPDVTAPATPQAQALDGSYGGFQPKPAVEVIIVAMKPLSEKTFVDQALANGHGVTWLEDGRIPTEEATWERPTMGDIRGGQWGQSSVRVPSSMQGSVAGRFPANLLCSDDVLDDGQDHKSSHGGGQSTDKTESSFGIGVGGHKSTQQYHDAGGFSRYFDLDAWWAERLKELPESAQRTFPFLEVPKASKREKGPDNDHPTVKPIKLMSYLITLGSRPGDLVLDPFLGSGTTVLAARALERRGIGYEIDKHSCEIAAARFRAAAGKE